MITQEFLAETGVSWPPVSLPPHEQRDSLQFGTAINFRGYSTIALRLGSFSRGSVAAVLGKGRHKTFTQPNPIRHGMVHKFSDDDEDYKCVYLKEELIPFRIFCHTRRRKWLWFCRLFSGGIQSQWRTCELVIVITTMSPSGGAII